MKRLSITHIWIRDPIFVNWQFREYDFKLLFFYYKNFFLVNCLSQIKLFWDILKTRLTDFNLLNILEEIPKCFSFSFCFLEKAISKLLWFLTISKWQDESGKIWSKYSNFFRVNHRAKKILHFKMRELIKKTKYLSATRQWTAKNRSSHP